VISLAYSVTQLQLPLGFPTSGCRLNRPIRLNLERLRLKFWLKRIGRLFLTILTESSPRHFND
jgi:hypothetical protein